MIIWTFVGHLKAFILKLSTFITPSRAVRVLLVRKSSFIVGVSWKSRWACSNAKRRMRGQKYVNCMKSSAEKNCDMTMLDFGVKTYLVSKGK
jgi:hypothetical protein